MKWSKLQCNFESEPPPLTGHSLQSIRYLEDPDNYTMIFIFGGITEKSIYSNIIYTIKIPDDGESIFGTVSETQIGSFHQVENLNAKLKPEGRNKTSMCTFKIIFQKNEEKEEKVKNFYSLILFGGMNENKKLLNDTWILNASPGEMCWIKPKFQTNSKQPKERFGHTICKHENKQQLNIYLFGGYNGNEYFNDIWMFKETKEEGVFEWLEIKGIPRFVDEDPLCIYENEIKPCGRFGHSSAIVKNSMLIFGGMNEYERLGDLWSLDLLTKRWLKLNFTGIPPSPRYDHIGISIANQDLRKEKYMIIFGGNTKKSKKYSNEIFAFHLDELLWLNLQQNGEENELKGRTSCSGSLFQKDKILIFGGLSKTKRNIVQRMNDFWCYDSELEKDKKKRIGSYWIDGSRKPLGSGAFATVYRAKSDDHKDTNEYALKMMNLEFDKSKDSVVNADILLSEIQVLMKLIHPNVLTLNDSFLDEDKTHFSIVMPLCDRGSLTEFIKDKKNNLSEMELLDLIVQFLNGISYIHNKQVIHRDIKSDNILLKTEKINDQERIFVKIADFGLAADAANDENLNIAGTPGHIAPEVTWQKSKYGVSSDLWAVSLVIFYTFFTPIAKKKKEFKNFKIESDQKFKLKISKTSKKEEIEKQVSSMIERMKTLWDATTYKYKDTYWNWMMNCLKINPEERPKANDLYNEGLLILQKEEPEKYKTTTITDQKEPVIEKLNVFSWLKTLGLDKYFKNFESNGYEDLRFLTDLSKEDLKEIRIDDENDLDSIFESLKSFSLDKELCKRLEEKIVLDFWDVPCWLKSIGLSMYCSNFDDCGFDDIEYIWENGLTNFEIKEIIGIKLLGHLKKLQYSIEEMKNILYKEDEKFELK
eukprot:gene8633-580_t